jgi:hypothetical protein
MIPVSVILAYPEPSNGHLKQDKRSKWFLPVSGAGKLLANHVCVFKQ